MTGVSACLSGLRSGSKDQMLERGESDEVFDIINR